MATSDVRIGGFGGQGVIMAGMILGKAAAIYDNRHAAMVQSFGPEARGSACSAQVKVADQQIQYPYVDEVDLLVAMSQEAFDLFVPKLRAGGTLIYEEDLVRLHGLPEGVRAYAIPATRFAEEMRRKMVLNIVMMGFVAAVSDVVTPDAMRKAVQASVPPGTEQLNLSAFDKGYDYGLEKTGRHLPPTEG